jgi:hypothetical protein
VSYSHWKSRGKSEIANDYDVYVLGDQDATHRIDLGHDNWLFVKERDGLTLEFALFEYLSGPSTINGAEVGGLEHIMRFRGSGPSGSLRECRHIWWGERPDGYTHCLNFALVEAAFRELRRWYDGD